MRKAEMDGGVSVAGGFSVAKGKTVGFAAEEGVKDGFAVEGGIAVADEDEMGGIAVAGGVAVADGDETVGLSAVVADSGGFAVAFVLRLLSRRSWRSKAGWHGR